MYEWKDKAAEQPLLELAKQKYPDMKFEQMDAFVGSLIDDVLLEKDAAKLTKGKVAILKDGKIYTIKAPNGVVTPQFLELVAKKNAGARVLNGAPTAELVALLKSMRN